MLYLVGGVSRAGKSILATRLLTNRGVSWFSLDVLRMGLFHGAPILGLDPDRDDLEEADRIWPVVRAMCANLMEYGQSYCLEGACLRPEQAAEVIEVFPGRVKACFLAYPHMDPASKVAFVKAHAGGSNDWLSRHDSGAIHSFVQSAITRSALMQAACDQLGIAFFDTGHEFHTTIMAAERSLVS